MGNKGRWEYLRAIYERYRKAGRKAKKVILSKFCANRGYHRKYAIRLRNGPRPEKRRTRRERRRRLSYKHHIPVKTDRWDVATPGFTEVDLVSHSGNSASGEFAHTLNVTDIHTTWTESRAVLGRGEGAVQRALNEILDGLTGSPKTILLSLDSSNDEAYSLPHDSISPKSS